MHRRTRKLIQTLVVVAAVIAAIQVGKPAFAYHAVRFIAVVPFLMVGLGIGIGLLRTMTERARKSQWRERPQADGLATAEAKPK